MFDVKKIGNSRLVIIVESATSVGRFKEIVQRGTNLWPDAAPEIKEFADIVTNDWADNKPLQNYRQQDTSPRDRTKFQTRSFECHVCHSDNLCDVLPDETQIVFICSHCYSSNSHQL